MTKGGAFMGEFTVSKVNQIVFMAKDTERSKKFYGEVLGLTKREEYGGMVFFQAGETTIMLHPEEAAAGNKNGIGIEFSVDNVDALVEKVGQSNLGKVVQEPVVREWGVREAIVEDPDGYEIWFTQQLK